MTVKEFLDYLSGSHHLHVLCTVVGNDVTDCEFTDNSIAALGKYYYTVRGIS